MANSRSIQNHCRFKIADAREKIFELSESTWAVYSIGTISTNQVCKQPMTSPPCKFSQVTPSRLSPDATFEPWTMSSRPTNPKQSKSRSRLGWRNHGPVQIQEQGRHPSGGARIAHSLQQRVWRHGLAESTGSAGPEKPGRPTRVPLDIHFTRGHDWSRHLPTRSRLPPVKVLLPDPKPDDRHPAVTLSTTDACPGGHHSTTTPNPQDPEARSQKQRQCYLQEQRHAQHHHHLKKNTSKTKNPKKGRDIGNNIICKFCKLV